MKGGTMFDAKRFNAVVDKAIQDIQIAKDEIDQIVQYLDSRKGE